MDNFNLRQYLTENKLTAVSKLTEGEEPNFNDPTTICKLGYTGDQVVGQGEGFNVAEIAKALEKGYELQAEKDKNRNNDLYSYAYFDWETSPDKNGVGVLEVNPTGKYNSPWGERQCDSFESAAQKFQRALTSCTPNELNSHVKGWIVVHSPKYRPSIYPMLDPEGVKIYLEAEDKLSADIDRFYRGCTYWGD